MLGYTVSDEPIRAREKYPPVWLILVQHNTIRYGVVWYDMVWYGMVWYAIIRNSMVWHDIT